MLNEIKEKTKNVSENKISVIEENEKTINIVERILYYNQLEQQKGERLKVLTPNQMLSRLLITLVQLKAENNSGKLKNEIRQLLHSLYRSKKTYKATL